MPLSFHAALSAAACRHDVEVPRHVRAARPHGQGKRHAVAGPSPRDCDGPATACRFPWPCGRAARTWRGTSTSCRHAAAERAAWKESGMQLLVHHNPEAMARGINPFDHGSLHTDLWKTEGLKQALAQYGFDAAFGGARRDEEKSRAKERIFSFRSANHRWEPKNQRPELWRLYNAKKARGESIRVFPISNWTELDVWQYIHLQNIPIVPLYFAAKRPTVVRDGLTLMVDDERFPLRP